METKYSYSIQGDFPNHKVSPDRLTNEIRLSAIVVALSHIDTVGDACDVWFKDALSPTDEALLDGLVAAHSGESLPVFEPSFQRDGAQRVAMVGREGIEYIGCTHDFCDKTTWWQHSVRVVDEVLTDSGDGLTFDAARQGWIDLYHGNVYEEFGIRNSVPHGFAVAVTVDGVPVVARKPFAPSGGDYTIDHAAGTITFAASQAGKTVRATYSYATDNEWTLQSQPKTVLELQYAEIQFAQDLSLVGAIVMTYWIDTTVVGVSRYDSVKQVVYESRGNYPPIKAFGGAARGVHQDIQVFPMTYMGVKRIFTDPAKAIANNGCTKVTAALLDHDDLPVECPGELATATFYGVWRAEDECCCA